MLTACKLVDVQQRSNSIFIFALQFTLEIYSLQHTVANSCPILNQVRELDPPWAVRLSACRQDVELLFPSEPNGAVRLHPRGVWFWASHYQKTKTGGYSKKS